MIGSTSMERYQYKGDFQGFLIVPGLGALNHAFAPHWKPRKSNYEAWYSAPD
jgi:hypothetical protein